jgi:hypothetical protein
MCPNRLFNLRRYLSDNGESYSIAAIFRRESDARLRYTLRYVLETRDFIAVLLFEPSLSGPARHELRVIASSDSASSGASYIFSAKANMAGVTAKA